MSNEAEDPALYVLTRIPERLLGDLWASICSAKHEIEPTLTAGHWRVASASTQHVNLAEDQGFNHSLAFGLMIDAVIDVSGSELLTQCLQPATGRRTITLEVNSNRSSRPTLRRDLGMMPNGCRNAYEVSFTFEVDGLDFHESDAKDPFRHRQKELLRELGSLPSFSGKVVIAPKG